MQNANITDLNFLFFRPSSFFSNDPDQFIADPDQVIDVTDPDQVIDVTDPDQVIDVTDQVIDVTDHNQVIVNKQIGPE